MANEQDETARELDALLVRNLAKFNAAAERLWFSVEPQVRGAIEGCVKSVADAHGWSGNFSLREFDLWLAPEEWVVRPDVEGDPGYLAHAWFDVRAEGADGVPGADHSWVISVCDEGRDSFGIWLNWDKELSTTKPKWIKAVLAHDVTPLVALGYAFDEGSGSFFRPIAFSSEALAEGLMGRDMTTFLVPLERALAELPQAISAFQGIIERVVAKPSAA